MAKELITRWDISNEDVENKILNCLLYTATRDFDFDIETEKKFVKDLTFRVTDYNDTTYDVINIHANSKNTFIQAIETESDRKQSEVTLVLPTRDAFYTLIFGNSN